VAAKLDELPADARAKALASLGRYPTEDAALEMLPLLKGDSDRVALAATYINPHNPGGKAVQALETLGSEALREQTLAQVAKRYAAGLSSGGGDEHTIQVREYFASTMTASGFSDAARERIEALLVPPPREEEEDEE